MEKPRQADASSIPSTQHALPGAVNGCGRPPGRLCKTSSTTPGAQATKSPHAETLDAKLVPLRQQGSHPGPSTLHKWETQKAIEEPYNATWPASQSDRVSKTTLATEAVCTRLHLSAVGDKGRGDTKKRPAESQDGRTGSKAANHGQGPVAPEQVLSYEDILRIGMKQGATRLRGMDSDLFACWCCKRLCFRFRARERGLSWSSRFGFCQFVVEERSIRTNLGERHLDSLHAPKNCQLISRATYEHLQGAFMQSARARANAHGLRGRKRLEYLWREIFVFFYPAYEPVKDSLDPYGYHESNLTDKRVLQIEACQWQLDGQGNLPQTERDVVIGDCTASHPSSTSAPNRPGVVGPPAENRQHLGAVNTNLTVRHEDGDPQSQSVTDSSARSEHLEEATPPETDGLDWENLVLDTPSGTGYSQLLDDSQWLPENPISLNLGSPGPAMIGRMGLGPWSPYDVGRSSNNVETYPPADPSVPSLVYGTATTMSTSASTQIQQIEQESGFPTTGLEVGEMLSGLVKYDDSNKGLGTVDPRYLDIHRQGPGFRQPRSPETVHFSSEEGDLDEIL